MKLNIIIHSLIEIYIIILYMNAISTTLVIYHFKKIVGLKLQFICIPRGLQFQW
jgi:hypothetical protein